MNMCLQPTSKIFSIGSYLPEEVVKSDHLLEEIKSDQQYGIPTTWMSERMGIIERRIAPSTMQPSELAIPAAKQAIENSNIDPCLINLVIFCGIERDYSEPATAHIIQNKLGLQANHIFDVSNACYGFIDGMEIASNYIKAGMVDYALIVTGEVPSRVLKAWLEKLRNGVSTSCAQKLIGGLSVGDAGGAVIMGRSEDGDPSGFNVFNKNVDSSQLKNCHYKVQENGDIEGQMLMARISILGFRMHKQIIPDTMAAVGWEKFDWMLSHQPGKRNYEQLSDLELVEKKNIVRIYPRLGNTTSATLPLSFKKMLQSGKLRRGDRVGGCFAGSGLTIGQFCYTI